MKEGQIFTVSKCDDIARKYAQKGNFFHALAFFNEASVFSTDIFNKEYFEDKADDCRRYLGI